MGFDDSRLDKVSDIYGLLEFMYQIGIKINATKIIEIGVRTGESTKTFIQVAEQTNGKLYSIDVTDCSKVLESDRWVFILSNSENIEKIRSYNLSDIDILFIDSSHTFLGTLFELENYSKFVRKGGYIFLHDIEKEVISSAIKEFLDRSEEYKYYTKEGWHGLGVMQKI